MKVFTDIRLSEVQQCWSACNGATRRILMIINKTGKELIPGVAYDVSLGVLDKGRHSYIFINNSKNQMIEFWAFSHVMLMAIELSLGKNCIPPDQLVVMVIQNSASEYMKWKQ